MVDEGAREYEYRGEDAAHYENQAAEVGWHGHEILFGMMYEFVKTGESLLDIGIGTGLSSVLFHQAGLRVSGFDKSLEMLRGCEPKGFSGGVIQHDLLDVPYPYESTSFNHAISLGVLIFFADLEPVFNEVARIIKPTGVFGFAVEERKPKHESQYTILLGGGGDQAGNAHAVTMYRHGEKAVRSLLEGVGFRVLKDFEFLADRYPEQGIDVYLTIYVAQRGVHSDSNE